MGLPLSRPFLLLAFALLSASSPRSRIFVQGRLGEQSSSNPDDGHAVVVDQDSPKTTPHDGVFRRLAEIHSEDHGRELTDDDYVDVIVAYKNKQGREAVEQYSSQVNVDLDSLIPAEAVTIKVSDLKKLAQDRNIKYVDVDDKIKGSQEAVPYGIEQVQNGPSTSLAKGAAKGGQSSGACSRSSSFKVAVLDSGAWANHPDSPCSKNNNCIGRDFQNGRGGSWNNPTSDHGT